MSTDRPLETGSLPDTPVDDTLLRQFLHNQAGVNEAFARAKDGRTHRGDGLFQCDANSAVSFLNQSIVTRPLTGDADAVLDEVEGFFRGTGRPTTLLSIWPTPGLSARGWTLAGHPAFVVRAPGPAAGNPRPGVSVRVAEKDDDFAAAELVLIDGYPLDAARGEPRGSQLPPTLRGSDVVVRTGFLADDPVGVGVVHVGSGLVNLCMGATLPAARRQGVWEALVWARVNEAPELPAVAYTSDYSRPGFIRMGFLPITRFTLWERQW